MGMGFAPTWLRQVSPVSPPPALLHMTTLTTVDDIGETKAQVYQQCGSGELVLASTCHAP